MTEFPFDGEALRAALLALPGVADAAVLSREDWTVAYVVPAGGRRPERARAEADALLSASLPGKTAACAVRRIPYDSRGRLVAGALAAVPVLDAASLPEHLGLRPAARELPAIALTDADAPVTTYPSPAGTPAAARPRTGTPAVADGGALVVRPDDPRTVTQALLEAAERFPALGVRTLGPAGDTFLTYPELLDRGRRALGGLRAHGLRPGSYAVLVTTDLADYVVAVWACLLGGIRFVTVSAPDSVRRRGPVLDKLIGAWRALDRPLVIGDDGTAPALATAGEVYGEPGPVTVAVSELLRHAPDLATHAADPADVAMCALSSGSTGNSKIIPVTHRAIVGNALASRQVGLIRPGEASLNWLPFDHVAPVVMFLLRDAVLGCDSLHAPTAWIAEAPLRWLDALQRYRVAHTWTANFGYRLVADALRDLPGRHWDLSAVRTMLNAGEQCTPPVIREFLERTAAFGVRAETMVHMWGMAETATAATYKFLATPGSHRRVLKASLGGALELAGPETAGDDCIEFLSMGGPTPGYRVRVTDDDHRPLPEGTIGRFQVLADRVTPGYLDNPQANAESFTPDGWFDTGDQAFILDGEVTITGRSKELIVINGEKYYCHEVEEVCATVGGVRPGLVAACGVPDPATGSERLAVFFVPEPADAFGPAERIRRAVGARLRLSATYVLPLPEAEFPRTTSGKIQRTALVRRTAAGDFDELIRTYAPGAARTVPACAYRPVWRPVARRPLPAAHPATLVFADPHGVADAWLTGEPDVTVVRGGDAYAAAGGVWTIDPARPAHWRRLRDDLAAAGRLPRRLLYLWSYLGDRRPWRENAAVRQDLARCGANLLSAIRTFGEGTELVTVSRRLRRVDGSEEVTYPAALAATLAGVHAAESAGSPARHIDLPGDPAPAEAETLRRALHDAAGRDGQVAWRAGRPYLSALEPVREPAEGRDALRRGGRYLVTGGTGGIGARLLAELADRYGLSLILVGRRDPQTDPLLREYLRELAEGGRDVRYERADVCDADALHRAVHRAERRWTAPIDGILHLADEYATRTLAEEVPSDWAAGSAAKISGTLNLVRLLSGRPFAELVVFSSLVGSLRLAGTGAYAAGNSFADALVENLRARGIRARSLAWGLWDGVGLNRDNPYQASVRRHGVLSLDPDAGALLARLALRQRPGTYHLGWDPAVPSVAALVDTVEELAGEALVLLDPSGAGPVSDVFGRPVPVLAGGSDAPAAPRDPAQARLADRIGDVLRTVVPFPPGGDQPFYELGIGSIGLLQLHAQLEEALDRPIDRSALFDHPTINTLAAHLASGDRAAAAV